MLTTNYQLLAMRLEHESQEKIKKELLRIIGEHLDLKKYKVFVFGSRVTGKGDEQSDIDAGIEGEQKISDGAIEKIKEELEELPILYKIDIVDFTRASKTFKKVVGERKEYLN